MNSYILDNLLIVATYELGALWRLDAFLLQVALRLPNLATDEYNELNITSNRISSRQSCLPKVEDGDSDNSNSSYLDDGHFDVGLIDAQKLSKASDQRASFVMDEVTGKNDVALDNCWQQLVGQPRRLFANGS